MAQNNLVITRQFNAPRELVFKVWTEAEHLSKWWGPKGFSLLAYKMDMRPGGIYHYSMTSPEGFVMWGRFDYIDIVKPEKIMLTSSFSNEDGNIVRAPFSEKWPLKILNNVSLTEEGGKTTLTISGYPANATDEERQVFEGFYANMQQGFAGTFDQLEEYLAVVAG